MHQDFTPIRSILKKERLRKGYSQAFMATQFNINQNTYSRMEAGTKKLNTLQLAIIADLFELELDYLLSLY